MMNSALKQEIIEAFRIGKSEIPDIARFYGVGEAQVEKVIFPNGRQRRMLPAVLPKIAKDITTLYGAEGLIRIPGQIKKFIPLSESKIKIVRKLPAESTRPAGMTPSKAKTPEGRLASLKAWETIRKQRAEAKGETYTPRSLEELKQLAGIYDKQPVNVVTNSVETPVVKQAVPEVVIIEPPKPPKPVQATVPVKPAVEEKKEDDLEIDYKPIVEMGRVVNAYCKQHNITLKELLESHQQLGLITKLLHK
jgi:hypothetical protein